MFPFPYRLALAGITVNLLSLFSFTNLVMDSFISVLDLSV